MKNLKTFNEFLNETTLNASYNNSIRYGGDLEKRLGIILQTQWNSIDADTSHLEKSEYDAFRKHGHFAVFTIESLPKGTPFSKSIQNLRDNVFLLIWEDGTYQFRKGMDPIPTPNHSNAEMSKIRSGAYMPRPLKELDLKCLNHCLSMAVNESEVNEKAMDTNYWTDYNDDTSGQSSKWHTTWNTDFKKTFDAAVTDWNYEADGPENKIKGSRINKIKKMAEEYFKIEKQIWKHIFQILILK